MPELYFEDFPVGRVFTAGPRRVGEAEIIRFAQAFDPQPFHLDRAAAQASLFGDLCASGWQTCGLQMRMMVDAFLHRTLSLGSPGIKTARWLKPVYVDDDLFLTSTVEEARRSRSRPDRGIVTFRSEVRDAKGTDKALIVTAVLIGARESA